MDRLNTIVGTVKSIDGVEITSPFVKEGEVILGSVTVSVPNVSLKFDLRISPAYPLQFLNSESIRFINGNLLKYNHVNADGSICVHTLHSPDLKEKLHFDFASLKEWIRKYYINETKDNHYEHIVVRKSNKSAYFFTSVNYIFQKGDFGTMTYSSLLTGFHLDQKIESHIVQQFKIGKSYYDCNWSSSYKSLEKKEGLFVFIDAPPTKNTRFAVDEWFDLEPYVNQEFLKFLNLISRNRHQVKNIPLLIGYTIPNNEIHWECVLIPTDNFPCYTEKIHSTTKYMGRLNDDAIDWMQTFNCSYDHFFGRGSFPLEITSSKILIIGVGAVGSNVATTLTRGGCKNITLIDYDLKEPENVCRAEYTFFSGVTSKVNELFNQLIQISPFVEVITNHGLMTYAKSVLDNIESRDELFQALKIFDIIFDCSTDNDVAYILDHLEYPKRIFTMSITNDANEFICAVPPKLYKWMNDLSRLLQKEENTVNLYNPNGCWNPTFKASYNDVATLVQFALKHISNGINKNLPLRSFYLSTSAENGLTINLKEF